MTNKFFPEEQITENALYFLCYMEERLLICSNNEHVTLTNAKTRGKVQTHGRAVCFDG